MLAAMTAAEANIEIADGDDGDQGWPQENGLDLAAAPPAKKLRTSEPAGALAAGSGANLSQHLNLSWLLQGPQTHPVSEATGTVLPANTTLLPNVEPPSAASLIPQAVHAIMQSVQPSGDGPSISNPINNRPVVNEAIPSSGLHPRAPNATDYVCCYCGTEKRSKSTGADQRVRIRCECGGFHRDGKPRMHANWRPKQKTEAVAPPAISFPSSEPPTVPSQQPLGLAIPAHVQSALTEMFASDPRAGKERPGLGKVPLKRCPQCQAEHSSSKRSCSCGHLFVKDSWRKKTHDGRQVEGGEASGVLAGSAIGASTTASFKDGSVQSSFAGQASQAYSCWYCGAKKVSASEGEDGRVRIRCECGGQHGDGIPRMHARWVPLESGDQLSRVMEANSRGRAQGQQLDGLEGQQGAAALVAAAGDLAAQSATPPSEEPTEHSIEALMEDDNNASERASDREEDIFTKASMLQLLGQMQAQMAASPGVTAPHAVPSAPSPYLSNEAGPTSSVSQLPTSTSNPITQLLENQVFCPHTANVEAYGHQI